MQEFFGPNFWPNTPDILPEYLQYGGRPAHMAQQIIAYSKRSADGSNEVLVVVNLDPHYKQSGFITLPLEELGLDPRQPYQAHDLLTEARYLWHGARNYVELDPQTVPAHIFVIRRKVRTEHDFDYYL